jgi:hypothetical protein
MERGFFIFFEIIHILNFSDIELYKQKKLLIMHRRFGFAIFIS